MEKMNLWIVVLTSAHHVRSIIAMGVILLCTVPNATSHPAEVVSMYISAKIVLQRFAWTVKW